jgi:hypothetical protein
MEKYGGGWVKIILQKGPVVLYGIILLMCGVAYYILPHALIKLHLKTSTIGIAIGSDKKGKLSVAIYAVAIAASFINAWMGFALYIIVAAVWIIPDSFYNLDAIYAINKMLQLAGEKKKKQRIERVVLKKSKLRNICHRTLDTGIFLKTSWNF